MKYLFQSQVDWNIFDKNMFTLFGLDYRPSEFKKEEITSENIVVSAFEGKKHTIESREKISNKLKTYQRTAEHQANNTSSLRGRKVSPEGLTKLRANRKPMSKETKKKIREKRALQVMNKGWKHSNETKCKIREKRSLQTNIKNQYSSSRKP